MSHRFPPGAPTRRGPAYAPRRRAAGGFADWPVSLASLEAPARRGRSPATIADLAICFASQATTSSKSRVVLSRRARPWNRLQVHAAVGAAQPCEVALNHAPVGAQIKVSPALDAAVGDLKKGAGLPAP